MALKTCSTKTALRVPYKFLSEDVTYEALFIWNSVVNENGGFALDDTH